MTPIQFPAGVTNLESKNSEIVNWRDANLIRWHGHGGVDTLRPIQGWEKLSFPTFTDKIRKMHRWSGNDGVVYTAYLCESHCYVEVGGVRIDITPAGGIAPPAGDNGGYGDQLYGRLKYGTPRPGPNKLRLYTPMFSMDNWGEDLRVMTSSDGRLLGWSPSAVAGTLLTAVTGAPTNNRSFIITPERHMMMFGMNAFDKFGWSDEEDDSDWAFADILSRAGYYDISPKSPITTHQLFDAGIIMFSPAMTYHIEYAGLPYVYRYRPIGKISVPISPASICETPEGVIWPSIDGWWLFDGTKPRIIPCPVWDFIIKTLDVTVARFTASCVHMSNSGEVWWFYPEKGAEDNSRYILFDYRGGTWSMGKLNRTCGFVYANDVNAIMSDGNNVWKHGVGYQYPEAPELPWIESHNLTPNGGENWFTINKILPEVVGDNAAIAFRVAKGNERHGMNGGAESTSPQRFIQTTGQGKGWVDIRETARDMRLRIEMIAPAEWSTVGPILFDMKMRGKK